MHRVEPTKHHKFEVKLTLTKEEKDRLRVAAFEAELCLAAFVRRVLMTYLDDSQGNQD